MIVFTAKWQTSLATLAMLGSGLLSSAALADVKAGVDAWSRGDFPTAVREWQADAVAGDADAQFDLAQAYKLGRGVQTDLDKAELLYARAASQGHRRASDELGLLQFDRGKRAEAMPRVQGAADHGDPRAQYLLAIAHFNGDLAPRDWVRAYALMSLARVQGLPQAVTGLTQMDGYIPQDQRQLGAGLAEKIAVETEAARKRDLASYDLGKIAVVDQPRPLTAGPTTVSPAAATTGAATPQVAKATPKPAVPAPQAAVAAATTVAANASPRTAGADFARPAEPVRPEPRPAAPAVVQVAPKPPAPVPAIAAAAPKKPAPAPAPAPAAVKPAEPPKPKVAAKGGTWRIQFGAFGVPANADALWAKLKTRPEVSGHPRINAAAGKVIKLQAGGYSPEAARAACKAISASGQTCVPVGD